MDSRLTLETQGLVVVKTQLLIIIVMINELPGKYVTVQRADKLSQTTM